MKCIPVAGNVNSEGSLIEEDDPDGLLVDVGDTLRPIRVADSPLCRHQSVPAFHARQLAATAVADASCFAGLATNVK